MIRGVRMSKGIEKKQKTEGAEALLRGMLKEQSFLPKAPDVRVAWDTFKEMSGIGFDCSEDELLFEAGVYDYSGKEMFCLSIVRQFTIIEDDGEYDYIKQLHMDFLYEPEAALRELSETIWTYDFDDDYGQFFEAVEKCPVFCTVQEGYSAVEFELYFDEI